MDEPTGRVGVGRITIDTIPYSIYGIMESACRIAQL